MQRLYLEEIDSTNNYLKNLRSIEDEMIFVFAEEQTKGRGYLESKWQSKKGESLTFSFALEIPKKFDSQKFNFWLSDTISDFFIKNFDLDMQLKWPNDLFVNNKKLGGILIEQTVGKQNRIIAGIGININQKEIVDFPHATSLFLCINRNIDAKVLFDDLSGFIYLSYLNFGLSTEDEFLMNYNRKLYAKNSIKNFVSNNIAFQAKILAVDKNGLLLLDLGNGNLKKFMHKEVGLLLS